MRRTLNNLAHIPAFILFISLMGCLFTPPLPPNDPSLPLADPNTPIFNESGDQVRTTPWTDAQRRAWQNEERARLRLEYEASWRSWCKYIALCFLIPIPLTIAIGLYLKSKALLIGGPIVALATAILIYAAGAIAPALIKPLIIASVIFLIIGFAAAIFHIARWLRKESTAFREVVATTQRTKAEPWNDTSRRLANALQSEYTKRRVTQEKATIP